MHKIVFPSHVYFFPIEMRFGIRTGQKKCLNGNILIDSQNNTYNNIIISPVGAACK